MFKLPGYILLTILLAFSFTQWALAQPEITVGNDFGVGARAMGMGGAFIGLADDFTALYWNPAGLSQIKRMEFFAGLSHEKSGTETEYFGNLASTFVTKTRPNSFGVVFPVPVYRGGLAFAFGVNRVQSFDSRGKGEGFNELSVEEDELGQLYLDELSTESGGIYSWSFGAAVDIAPGVSLGGSLDFLDGDYRYELETDADDKEDLDPEWAGISYRDITDADYFGVEGKIGLLARIGEQVRLGTTIVAPLTFSADQDVIQDSYYEYDDGTNESDRVGSGASYDISRPFRFSVGLAACPVPGAIIDADICYTDWTQTEYSELPWKDVSNQDFVDEYRDAVQVRVGGEYAIPNAGLRIRAGYQYDPLPYTPEYLVIDTDRQSITAGLGMMLDKVMSLDIAYVYSFWETNADISVETQNSHRIFLSAGYRF